MYYGGFSGGIYRDCSLKIGGPVTIDYVYVHPDTGLETLKWEVSVSMMVHIAAEISGKAGPGCMEWKISGPVEGKEVISGHQPVDFSGTGGSGNAGGDSGSAVNFNCVKDSRDMTGFGSAANSPR